MVDDTPSFAIPVKCGYKASDEPPKIDLFATTNAAGAKLSTIPLRRNLKSQLFPSALLNDTNQLNAPVAPAPSQPIAPIEPAITNLK